MWYKNIFLLVSSLLITLIGLCQSNYLKISGKVFAEKAGASQVSIIVINTDNQDTIKVVKVIPEKNLTRGVYSLKLDLNKNFKLIFQGDTSYQETRIIDVSTDLLGDPANKNYSLDKLFMDIYIRQRVKEEGTIVFDKNIHEFKLIRKNY